MKKLDKSVKNFSFSHYNFSRKNRKGLSRIVMTLVLIVVVLMAVGIIWAVVSSILQKGSKDISLEALTISLEIEKVFIEEKNNDQIIHVNVKRNTGGGDLDGVAIILGNKQDNKVVLTNVSLDVLESREFEVGYKGLLETVSVAPVFQDNVGNIANSFELDKAREVSCSALWNCGVWKKCKSFYLIDDVLADNTIVHGFQMRSCYDKISCETPIEENQDCNPTVKIVARRSDTPAGDGVEIYDAHSEKLIGRIDRVDIPDYPDLTRIDISFI